MSKKRTADQYLTLYIPKFYTDTDGDTLRTDLVDQIEAIETLGGRFYSLTAAPDNFYELKCFLPLLPEPKSSKGE